MTLETTFIFFTSIWFPAVCTIANPFLALISRMLCHKRLGPALWIACMSGAFRDVLLASPKVGILALSSLVSCRIAFAYVSLVTIEGIKGWLQVTAILALLDSLLSTFFCFVINPSTFHVPSWKALFLSVVFACMWTAGLYTIHVWRTKRARRRT